MNRRTGSLPPLEQLALDVAELLDRIEVEVEEDAHGQSIRRHRMSSPGLLRLAGSPVVLAPGRGSDGSERPSGFGSRPPLRVDLLALPQMIVADALALLEKYAPDMRAPRTAAEALHAMSHLASTTVDRDVRRDTCSAVASLADSARIALGFLEPPIVVPLRCLYCHEQLVCPSTPTGRYLLCRNRACRCDVADHCTEERGRRHRWDEHELGIVIAANARIA